MEANRNNAGESTPLEVVETHESASVSDYTSMASTAHTARTEEDDNREETRHVTSLIRNKVFPQVKFVATESQLDIKGKIARRLCKELGIKDQVTKKDFWRRYRELVRKKITEFRNSAVKMIKDKVRSKYNVVL
jgi:hypothetical protein